MAFNKANLSEIDLSDPADYPTGQIRDNDGSDNGTPVSRQSFSDIFETFTALMAAAGIAYNNQFDNVSNGYQYLNALKFLAGKNDLIQQLTTATDVIAGVNTSVLVLPLVIAKLQVNELLFCQAIADYAAQGQIRGNTAGTYKNIISSSPYKANDYLLVVNQGGGVKILTFPTSDSLNRLVGESNYLKAASNLEEINGVIINKATTPNSNLTAFIDRVNGDSSDTFLATDSQNGLLSAADKVKIDTFQDPVRNRGWFSGVDPGGNTVGENYTHSGDVVSAILQSQATAPGAVFILVTMANAMDDINYFVRIAIESEGNLAFDNDCLVPAFKKLSTTQFQVSVQEAYATTQSLKIHIEAVQL